MIFILRDELKECIPITAITKTFPCFHKNKTAPVQPKQFPLKLGHAINVHIYQGSTLENIRGDLDHTSKNGEPNTAKINQVPMYTKVSCAKSRDKFYLLNFESEYIRENIAALQKTSQNGKGSIFF